MIFGKTPDNKVAATVKYASLGLNSKGNMSLMLVLNAKTGEHVFYSHDLFEQPMERMLDVMHFFNARSIHDIKGRACRIDETSKHLSNLYHIVEDSRLLRDLTIKED